MGILGKNLRLERPVLIELRESLHEIAGHIGTAHIHVTAFREHSVQCMTELMERGLDLVDGKRCHGIVRLAEVADIDDDRTHVLAGSIHILLTEVGHPCTATFRAARKVVSKEEAEL